MLLETGVRLGPYEIGALIGAGGMGEVYRATDTRLHRDVAIKISTEQFTDRFEREARAVAALNHPNICTLHDVGPNYLVMEYIEGPTLADRIAQGPMPIDEALPIARQIADALEAAHEKGIVHRDLKPGNIKFTPQGTVKVLDFGLAKLPESEPETTSQNSPTLTLEAATRVGTVLGTGGYMAPEQARGKKVDKRADIWAFGVVLYEMLTGKMLFAGETISDTLAAVLKSEPDLERVPERVRSLLRRCLEKDPKKRLRDIGDLDLLLDAPSPAKPAYGRSWLPWATLAASLAAVALWGWLRAPPTASRPVARWTVTLPEPSIVNVALSRDGTRLVYGDGTSSPLILRMMNEFEGKPLAGTEGARGPAFSPDGQWIAYTTTAGAQLKKVPVSGGASITLATLNLQQGRTWGENGTIIIGSPEGLKRVSAAGGEPQSLTTLDAQKRETFHSQPQFLPGEQTVLFTIVAESGRQIAVLDLNKGTSHVVINDGAHGRYVPTGHLVYERRGTLFAAPFDSARLEVTGPEAPVIEGLASESRNFGSRYAYAFSDSGLLVYLAGSRQRENRTLAWVDRKGNVQASSLPPREYQNVRISPDGQRVAAAIGGDSIGDADIWVGELERGTLTRLTAEGLNRDPVWTPDGRRVTFVGGTFNTGGIKQIAADGSGKPEMLLGGGVRVTISSFTPDGKVLLFSRAPGPGSQDGRGQSSSLRRPFLWLLSVDGSGKADEPRPFLESTFAETNAQVSPVGGWMAYESTESGKSEVYVRPFPGPGGKTLVSTEGGVSPRWSRSGRELFYEDPNHRIMAVEIQTVPAFRAGQPRALFEVPTLPVPLSAEPLTQARGAWDVAPDGSRFLVIKPMEAPATGSKLNVVTDWFEELRHRVPVKH